MDKYIPKINIEVNKSPYMYCTSCGCSEQANTIYDISFDNMKIHICGICMDYLYKGLNSMRK